ncbi:DinI-like family protein [Deinococcus marmoris]|uniref:DinI-like family protein n=1 Tax=Deinococcus marmoris TaxID=249408 RepID=UPI00049507FD|nr:DinI-like family protein [Deinococcus marmoris]
MTEPIEDQQDSEATGYTRQIEIRMVFPEKIRYEKGKAVKEPGPDPERVIAALRSEVERGVQDRYGEETQVIFRVAQAPSIRVTGQFGEKVAITAAFVQEVLDGAFEHLVVE